MVQLQQSTKALAAYPVLPIIEVPIAKQANKVPLSATAKWAAPRPYLVLEKESVLFGLDMLVIHNKLGYQLPKSLKD